MARSIWTGALSFGLVSIPVGLYSATHEHEVRFHQFEKGTSSRIRYRRVNQDTGEEVDYSDIVKGAELPDGDYVILTDEELEEVEPKRTRAIEITDFVELSAIDPIYFQKSYYLGPRDEQSSKPYALLASAIEKSGRAGIASFVLRNKEYLAVIRPYEGVLMLETMFFADEVRDPKKAVDDLPGKVKLSANEMKMARQLVSSMSGPFRAKDYRDTYTDAVNKLLKAKAKNQQVEEAEAAPEPTDVVDLMEALRESIAKAGGGRKTTSRSHRKPAARRTAAKKAPAKKAARSTGKKAAKKTARRKAA